MNKVENFLDFLNEEKKQVDESVKTAVISEKELAKENKGREGKKALINGKEEPDSIYLDDAIILYKLSRGVIIHSYVGNQVHSVYLTKAVKSILKKYL